MDEEKKKQKSALYPAATIEECLEILNILKSLGGKSCSVQTIADKIGVSITTNSFKAKISSAKQFGLIDNVRGVIQLTERGRSILYPTSSVIERDILIDCFQSAPLYIKIIQSFMGKALPSPERLANELLKPMYGITVAGKDLAADCFIKSAEYLGIIQNGILSFDKLENTDTETVVENVDDGIIETQVEIQDKKSTTQTEKSVAFNSGYHFQIPMLSGATAEIYLPDNIKIIDLDFFEQAVNCMLPLFIKNLKTTLSESENKTESE